MEDLYGMGWRQGAVFDTSLPASWLAHGHGGNAEAATEDFGRWVVCSQDCDLRAAPADSRETQIEIRPVLEVDTPDDWGILIENSYAADLSQLTWRGEQPTGAE